MTTLFDVWNDMDHLGREIMRAYLGPRVSTPDLIIAPDGNPYLYRWYLTPHNQTFGNVYFHLQTASDPERPLHDHPWDNASNVLRHGYTEYLQRIPPHGPVLKHERRPGQFITRKSHEAHRLELPACVPYTLTIFTTGPRIREWGFWFPTGWVPFREVTQMREDGLTSIHVPGGRTI